MTIIKNSINYLTFEGNSALLNPWYNLPEPPVGFGAIGYNEKPNIFQNCYIQIPNTGIELFLSTNEIAFVITGDSALEDRYLINPIIYFLSYRSYVDINVFHNGIGDGINTDEFPATQEIIFNLSETNIESLGRGKRDNIQIAIKTKELTEFIEVLDFALYYALSFYFIGSKNQRYFLVEYYKAIEAITNKLGGKSKGVKILKPFGLNKSLFSNFGKISNDAREAPVDIGRHAPESNVELFSIDLRNILAEPRSFEIFNTGISCCRQVIDAYLKYLISNRHS